MRFERNLSQGNNAITINRISDKEFSLLPFGQSYTLKDLLLREYVRKKTHECKATPPFPTLNVFSIPIEFLIAELWLKGPVTPRVGVCNSIKRSGIALKRTKHRGKKGSEGDEIEWNERNVKRGKRKVHGRARVTKSKRWTNDLWWKEAYRKILSRRMSAWIFSSNLFELPFEKSRLARI